MYAVFVIVLFWVKAAYKLLQWFTNLSLENNFTSTDLPHAHCSQFSVSHVSVSASPPPASHLALNSLLHGRSCMADLLLCDVNAVLDMLHVLYTNILIMIMRFQSWSDESIATVCIKSLEQNVRCFGYRISLLTEFSVHEVKSIIVKLQLFSVCF